MLRRPFFSRPAVIRMDYYFGRCAGLVHRYIGVSCLVLVRRGKLPVRCGYAEESYHFGQLKTRISSTVTRFKIVSQFGTFGTLKLADLVRLLDLLWLHSYNN